MAESVNAEHLMNQFTCLFPVTVGVMAHPAKPAAMQAALRLARHLGHYGNNVRVLVRESAGESLPPSCVLADEDAIAQADFIVVFGGDGTLLATARCAAPHGTPLLGIHLGHFGFLTEAAPEHALRAVEQVLRGEATVEERLMLRATLHRSGTHEAQEVTAVNDIVTASRAVRMIHVRAQIGNQPLTTYAADGVIVASPTGSTGYSLSAGGPLVHPAVPVMLVTPICPHTLSARALIVPDGETVHLTIEGDTRDEAVVSVDGQQEFALSPGDTVRVTRAPYSVRFLQVGGPPFYEKIRTRWHLGERNARPADGP
jgi:NAD+ kinase